MSKNDLLEKLEDSLKTLLNKVCSKKFNLKKIKDIC